jgi:serine/threonine-protein kinase HipA
MQMVFNVVASNRDDHTKNFSFLMDENGQWSLSPAYDLTFPFDPYHSFVIPHQISINNKVKGINREDLVATAKKVGILRHNEMIDNVVDNLASFSSRIKQYGLNEKTIQLVVADIEKNISRVKPSSNN